ncbi:hypothetical protein [Reyranella sp.]|uniref:hypothetical protein n=1 Tax=Reyranella sp. TaxID=1929291 RepID=UPI00272CFAE1|nr:hypothetical protein [Reyranella sp.]
MDAIAPCFARERDLADPRPGEHRDYHAGRIAHGLWLSDRNELHLAAAPILTSIVDRVHDVGIANEDELRREIGTQEIFDMLRDKASSVLQENRRAPWAR